MSTECRLALPADVPNINALTGRSIRALHAGTYDGAIIDVAVKHAYGVDWQLIRDETYFVVEQNDVIVGAGGWSYRQTIAGAHAIDAPPAGLLDPDRDAARIRAFYVDPTCVRQGVGGLLLNVSEDAARAHGFTTAELTSTLPAVPFYTRLGYRRVRPFAFPLPGGLFLSLELMAKSLVL